MSLPQVVDLAYVPGLLLVVLFASGCGESTVDLTAEDLCDPSVSQLPDTVVPPTVVAPAPVDTIRRPRLADFLLSRPDSGGSMLERIDMLVATVTTSDWHQSYRLPIRLRTASGDDETLAFPSEVCRWGGTSSVYLCRAFVLVWDTGGSISGVVADVEALQGRVVWDNGRSALISAPERDTWSAAHHARSWKGVCTTALAARGQFFLHDLELQVSFERGSPVPGDGHLQVNWTDHSVIDDQVTIEYTQPDGTTVQRTLGG